MIEIKKNSEKGNKMKSQKNREGKVTVEKKREQRAKSRKQQSVSGM